MPQKAVYVYCVISAKTRPRVSRAARGLPGMGPVRLLEVERGLWVAVADAPLRRYGEATINRGLADLAWVSRAALAHEEVIESFIGETAVLPMKLFTIFTSDARALEHIAAQRTRIAALVKRVANHQEWGVRVVLDRVRAERISVDGSRRTGPLRPATSTGAAYLTRKRAQRDATVELGSRARAIVVGLYDRLGARSKLAKRRPASELPVQGGPLLLDAAFLVLRTRAASFKALTVREARTLFKQGYGVKVSGPWPPYTFVQD
jgi:hypothetical protein